MTQLNSPAEHRIHVGVRRRETAALEILDLPPRYAAELSLSEHDEKVETLPPDRADQPFDVSVIGYVGAGALTSC
jgi:hypothetical protein